MPEVKSTEPPILAYMRETKTGGGRGKRKPRNEAVILSIRIFG